MFHQHGRGKGLTCLSLALALPHCELPTVLVCSQEADPLAVSLSDLVFEAPGDAAVVGVRRCLDCMLETDGLTLKHCKALTLASSICAFMVVESRLDAKLSIATDKRPRLARLSVSACQVFQHIELNDPSSFNNQSSALLFDLIECCTIAENCACLDFVGALLLSGTGAHFCTGGRLDEGGMSPQPSYRAVLNGLMQVNDLATNLRKMPVPTTAAVHGKLIGGGVALCLATQQRIAAASASFCFGNLPRGKNPLFMLSRSLPSAAGAVAAMAMYLEDPIISAQAAFDCGIVHLVANDARHAKAIAHDVVYRKSCLQAARFKHDEHVNNTSHSG